MYEISLVVDKGHYFKTYESAIIPITGDFIGLENAKVFEVERRLLPTRGNRVVLVGTIKNYITEFLKD